MLQHYSTPEQSNMQAVSDGSEPLLDGLVCDAGYWLRVAGTRRLDIPDIR